MESTDKKQGGHPQQGVGKTKTYGCYYSNARLLYTATLVKDSAGHWLVSSMTGDFAANEGP